MLEVSKKPPLVDAQLSGSSFYLCKLRDEFGNSFVCKGKN